MFRNQQWFEWFGGHVLKLVSNTLNEQNEEEINNPPDTPWLENREYLDAAYDADYITSEEPVPDDNEYEIGFNELTLTVDDISFEAICNNNQA